MAETKSKPTASQKATDEEPPSDDEDGDDEEAGPTFGDMALDAPEGESEDEDFDEPVDDEANDMNANGVYYKDFFAPPRKKYNGSKPKKAVRFEPKQPNEADVQRAMDDVRRDLFDDESEQEDSDDALSDASAGNPKSRRSAHERRQAKLAEEIRKLEAASVAKREWAMAGEATAVSRPMNSLLEEDLDFEHLGKPVPVITPEVTEGIEELIKRRILAQEFDEVIRRRPDSEIVPSGTRRGLLELDDSKATKGLAEIYEEEHVKNTNPDTYVSQSDEKLQREEKEIENMWRDVSARLDSLSSWHYKPKPVAPAISVVADVATVAMEDAQPSTAQGVTGESSRMAPQEIYKAGDSADKGEVVTKGGMPLARQELSREDKARRRRREKERVRKAGGVDGGKVVSHRAKMRNDTIAELKKGNVKVINRKGEITDVDGNKAKKAKAVTSGGFKL
ncbi:U3 small nucleolar ribonucleoprotein complex, subunit Mpp10 [Thelonectria olida]|uniref:U3 small nucleolar ribonucleoprotein complex, subunit Mpp10 n=1 Tax=Thelonectria olida TaxID=1576542 RepID=A0A9P9ATA3_9HYPO|nr:U3 small nucleolar ribonucleoprotein complex, subunit Mpp10 [Thelonectria olida]